MLCVYLMSFSIYVNNQFRMDSKLQAKVLSIQQVIPFQYTGM